jgi:hypothetical protein
MQSAIRTDVHAITQIGIIAMLIGGKLAIDLGHLGLCLAWQELHVVEGALPREAAHANLTCPLRQPAQVGSDALNQVVPFHPCSDN